MFRAHPRASDAARSTSLDSILLLFRCSHFRSSDLVWPFSATSVDAVCRRRRLVFRFPLPSGFLLGQSVVDAFGLGF